MNFAFIVLFPSLQTKQVCEFLNVLPWLATSYLLNGKPSSLQLGLVQLNRFISIYSSPNLVYSSSVNFIPVQIQLLKLLKFS